MITMHALNILLACFVLVLFSSSQGFETREVSLLLNSDGSLTYPAITPNCGKDRKINLIDYSYRHVRCHFADDCYTDYEEQLSAAAELLLHDMCSWKEKCNNLRFPLRSAEQINRINAAALKYSCVGQRNTFNICKGVEMYINNTIYLTSYDDARLYTECFCFINKGEFSMTINDLRLWRKNEGLCSPAGLLINSEPYACDEKKEGLDSIFHKNVTYTSVNAFVSLKLNSRTVVPDMVMLKISPKEKSRIYCNSKPSSSVLVTEKDPWPISRPVGSVIHTSAATSLQKTNQGLTDHNTGKQHKSISDSSSARPYITGLVSLCVVLILLIIILIVCIVCLVRSKPELISRFPSILRQKRKKDQKGEEKGIPLVEGPQHDQNRTSRTGPQTTPGEARTVQGSCSEESIVRMEDRSQHFIQQSTNHHLLLASPAVSINRQQFPLSATVKQLNPENIRQLSMSTPCLNIFSANDSSKHISQHSDGKSEPVLFQPASPFNFTPGLPQFSEKGVNLITVCNTPWDSCEDVAYNDTMAKTPFIS